MGLLGANGSGKTTLVRVLLGQEDRFEGQIVIRNFDGKEVNLREDKRAFRKLLRFCP
jgi:ABC-type multidrug transport system ATPase subunit